MTMCVFIFRIVSIVYALNKNLNVTKCTLLIESSYPMEIVHIDFLVIGSKKSVNKEISVLVVTDHFTRYAQAFVKTSQTSHMVAVTLYEKYLVHYGWPEKLHSDQAGNFESHLIAELCKIAQVQKVRMTPYHPEGNAQCERFNQTLLGMVGEKCRWQDWVSTLNTCLQLYPL